MQSRDDEALARKLDLELMAEGMNPPGFRMKELIKTVGERTPQIELNDDRLRFEPEMLLSPEDRKEHNAAVKKLEYDFSPDKPIRMQDEPFSEFSRRLIDYASKKSLKSRE